MTFRILKTILCLVFSIPFGIYAQQTNTRDQALALIQNAQWHTESLQKGFTYRYFQFPELFNSKQSVTVFEFDLRKGIEVEITAPESGFIKTSVAGEEQGAIAAVNGSFFNVNKGGSAVFFKQDSKIIQAENPKKNNYMGNAGFALSRRGKVSILKRPEQGWEAVKQPTVLSSGPLLLFEGEILEQVSAAFNTNRHPRTAVGLTKDNRLIAVVVDGRNANAQGMSIHELTLLMKGLGCKTAMNLDGGGSSAAWIKGKGVVNYPSDNKLFDHKGERAVVTVLLFQEHK